MVVLIRKARIADLQSEFNDQVVDILIENGLVKNIAPQIDAAGATVVGAEGLTVSPGWVDTFADYREPGYEHKETIASGLAAAAAGGYTDVMIVPNTNPVVSTKAIVQYVKQQAAGHIVNLHPLGSITQGAEGKELAEMMDMRAHGAVAFTDGWKPIQNAGLMLKALEYVKAFDGTLVQLPTDTALAKYGLMNEGPVSTSLGMPGIPALAEDMIVHRDIELARYTGSRLHISGVSTAASVAMVRQAKAEKLPITCSVTPYHLALTDEALRSYDSVYKVMPPLRDETDRLALIEGIKDGTIDCIASHHRPQEWDAKAKEFEYASEGMNLQEVAFRIVWQALENDLTPAGITRLFTTAPRNIFGLEESVVGIGNNANFTIFTADDSAVLEAAAIKSMSANNPFIGKTLKGKIIGIINGNKLLLN